MREADLQEIAASSGEDPTQVLIQSVGLSSQSWTVHYGGHPAMIFGVATAVDDSKVGIIWMMSSPEISRFRFRFARQAHRWVSRLGVDYELMCNVVDARNKMHIRFLHWLGFSFIKLYPQWGKEKRPFYEFCIACD